MAFVDRFGGRVTYDIATLREYAGRDLDERPRFDEIYHLASPVGPVGILRHAGRIAGAIVGDADRAVDLACRSGARLCLASTSEIYGGGRGGACAESDDRVIRAEPSVRLEYAAGKLAAEIATINAARHRGLRAVVIRPFNVAGPGQSGEGGFVLPRFVRQALSGEPITVYGDGSAVRALTHVDDVSDGIVRALRGGRSGAAYNLGNAANRTTILDLAGLVLRVTGSSSPISHVDPRDLHGDLFAEAPDKFPDGDLARRELGWSPSRDLERVVRDAVDDARSQM
jgi:UDP-glucose 4-epimerase